MTEAAADLQLGNGLDPMNVIRDPPTKKRIGTGAWNAILSTAEALAL